MLLLIGQTYIGKLNRTKLKFLVLNREHFLLLFHIMKFQSQIFTFKSNLQRYLHNKQICQLIMTVENFFKQTVNQNFNAVLEVCKVDHKGTSGLTVNHPLGNET